MYNNKKILCVIPARGDSKGLPDKNIKKLLGKPLIVYSIEQALNSKYIDRVIVSTDDKKIADISRKYGAEVPFVRPKKLATDDANGVDVVLHAISWMEKNIETFDIVILLQPTSPLRTTEDINNSIKLLFLKRAQTIVSICETEHHPYWSNTLPKNGNMKNFIRKEIINKNRQQLPTFYRLNGAIYIAYCNYLKNLKGFISKRTYAYIMSQERSVDIDDYIDFEIAKILLKKREIKCIKMLELYHD